MHAKFTRIAVLGLMAGALALSSGCGEFVRQGSGPTSIVIDMIEGSQGSTPDKWTGNLSSDVITIVKRQVNGQQTDVPTIFGDNGRVTMRLLLKDQGAPSVTNVPSPINEVTITRYRVNYRRADGRNTPGVDVPYGFDGGVTFTIPAQGTVQAAFDLVRHDAKMEAPLAALANNPQIITTIAELTFYGRDQAGHDVQAVGSISVSFGNFGDPTS